MKKSISILSLVIGILVYATVLTSCSKDNEQPEIEQYLPKEGDTFTSEDGRFRYTFINGGKELELTSVNHSAGILEKEYYYGKYYPVTRIGGGACGSDTYISEVPEGIVSIGRGAFYLNTHEYIRLPSTLKIIEKQTFEFNTFCKVDISFGTTDIEDYAFASCKNLDTINIPESVKSIGERAFLGCSDLSYITIPNSVTSIGAHAFYGCGLSSLTIPSSVTTISESSFSGCPIKSLTLPEGIEAIEEAAFASCKELSEVNLPNSLKSIGVNAFQQCKSLLSITIPKSVTSIGVSAFNTRVSTYIGNGNYNEEDRLMKVISMIDNPFPINRVFSDNFNNYGILYVPKGTIEKYKSTEGWKEIQTIIEQ